MPFFLDQLQRTVEIPSSPQRIVSLVPSQTELLHDLGLGERVVGITTFCVRPEIWFRTKPRVGGTKQLNIEAIRTLKPDLILGNREENERSQIEALSKEFPVWMSDIFDLPDALDMIAGVGAMVDKSVEAEALGREITLRFERFTSERQGRGGEPRTAAYLIWRKPYMVAGHSTFITEMMRMCGLRNVFEADVSSRYPVVSEADLQRVSPDLLLLSSEPFPFAEKHIAEFAAICPRSRVLTVDGEVFSWYGPRLLHAPEYFAEFLGQL